MTTWFQYQASDSGISFPADLTDLFQLRMGATTRAEILEVQIFQTSLTAIDMNAVQIVRGASGATGTLQTAHEWDIRGPTAVGTVSTEPGTDVSSADMDLVYGWNVLQPFVWLPTPEIYIHLAASDHLGFAMVNTLAFTGGYNIIWREAGV